MPKDCFTVTFGDLRDREEILERKIFLKDAEFTFEDGVCFDS